MDSETINGSIDTTETVIAQYFELKSMTLSRKGADVSKIMK